MLSSILLFCKGLICLSVLIEGHILKKSAKKQNPTDQLSPIVIPPVRVPLYNAVHEEDFYYVEKDVTGPDKSYYEYVNENGETVEFRYYKPYEPNIVVIRQIRPLNINEIEAVFKSEPYNNYLRNGLSQHIDINAKYVYKNEKTCETYHSPAAATLMINVFRQNVHELNRAKKADKN